MEEGGIPAIKYFQSINPQSTKERNISLVVVEESLARQAWMAKYRFCKCHSYAQER